MTGLRQESLVVNAVDNEPAHIGKEHFGAHAVRQHLVLYLWVAHQVGEVLQQWVFVFAPRLVLGPCHAAPRYLTAFTEYLEHLKVHGHAGGLASIGMRNPLPVGIVVLEVHRLSCKACPRPGG